MEWLEQLNFDFVTHFNDLSKPYIWSFSKESKEPQGLAAFPFHWKEKLLGYFVVNAHEAELKKDPELFELQYQHLEFLAKQECRLTYELQNTLSELISKYDELSILYDSAETVATILDLEDVCHKILELASDSLDVEHASVMLLDDNEEFLTTFASRGSRKPRGGETQKIIIGEGISGEVAKTGDPILIENLKTHERFQRSELRQEGSRSLMSVPLKIKDRVLGVLNVTDKVNGEQFYSNDLKLLLAMAQLAAISIQNARTYQNAITDRLTSLYNYGYFREQLDKTIQIAKESQEGFSLLMFDIDHFKNFNDVNGHELANVALVRVSSMCMDNFRQRQDRVPDLVARYGGEEFMVILQQTEKKDAMSIAERIRQLIASTSFNGGENQPGGRLTISLGVASYPLDAQDSDGLINAADEALYQAKRSGRNNVQGA